MRDYFTYIPIVLVYFAFTGTVFTDIPMPDLTVLLAFYLSYKRPSPTGVLLVFIIGYIEDSVCGGILGSSSAALTLIYALGFILSGRVQYSDPFTKTYMLFGASLLKSLIIFAIVSLVINTPVFETFTIITAAVTGLLAPVFMKILASIDSRVEIILGKIDRSL